MKLTRVMALTMSLVLASCTSGVEGLSNFREKAETKKTIFDVSYQKLFLCFQDNVKVAPVLFGQIDSDFNVYPALGLARYAHRTGSYFFHMIEFKKVTGDKTEVTAMHAPQAAPSVLKDFWEDKWGTVEKCSEV